MRPAELHSDLATDARLRAFAAAVRESPHNLVSRRAREELLERHVPECVRFAATLPQGPGRVLDLGSGGGFPGVIVAVARPDLDVHLLDATAKKTAFLETVTRDLGLSLPVHTGRAEDLSQDPTLNATFDVVTARAVAPLDRLIGWSLPFLRSGGLLYAMKGERWQEEVAAAADMIARSGASLIATPDDVHTPGAQKAAWEPRVVIVARGPR